MTIDTKYCLGDVVYLRADNEKQPYIIIQILIKPSGLEFCLSAGTYNQWNYEFEFSKSKSK